MIRPNEGCIYAFCSVAAAYMRTHPPPEFESAADVVTAAGPATAATGVPAAILVIDSVTASAFAHSELSNFE